MRRPGFPGEGRGREKRIRGGRARDATRGTSPSPPLHPALLLQGPTPRLGRQSENPAQIHAQAGPGGGQSDRDQGARADHKVPPLARRRGRHLAGRRQRGGRGGVGAETGDEGGGEGFWGHRKLGVERRRWGNPGCGRAPTTSPPF
jgi:hypothetical protein